MTETEQLAALARIHDLLEVHAVEYWLFGGWAVDFHAGSVMRPHDDLDVAVWLEDHKAFAELLAADEWEHEPQVGEDGYTGYRRGQVRLEPAFLAPVRIAACIRRCARAAPTGRAVRSGTTFARCAECTPGSSAFRR